MVNEFVVDEVVVVKFIIGLVIVEISGIIFFLVNQIQFEFPGFTTIRFAGGVVGRLRSLGSGHHMVGVDMYECKTNQTGSDPWKCLNDYNRELRNDTI